MALFPSEREINKRMHSLGHEMKDPKKSDQLLRMRPAQVTEVRG